MADVRRVGVVVPARDEAAHVVQCLTALQRSAALVDLPVEIVVVVNGTTDDTADLARRRGATVLERAEPGVGVARAIGVDHVLAGSDPAETWVATTDADSVVPPRWLAHHLALAGAGADAVVGTIRLDTDAGPRHARWWQDYQRGIGAGGHRHVHGANLGLLGSVYRAVGGFSALQAHEDADLVRRVEAAGRRVVWTTEQPVVTSARLEGRAPAGVAADLRTWPARTPAAPEAG